MNKHTPGPWKAVKNFTYYSLVDSLNREFGTIGIVSNESSEDESNARLIAAAPEMYNALVRIAEDPECPDIVANYILPIIAKAEGK